MDGNRPESERWSLVGGIVTGLAGVSLLVWDDTPYLARGGWPAALAGLELLAAVTILSLSLAYAATTRSSRRR